MTHLHIADGVLPPWLWASGLVLALVIAGLASFARRHERADRLALLAALSAVMLAAMSIPLGPLGHLSLAPVVGILLGSGAGFLAALLVNAILALLGHGGLTVVGLNALVLGASTSAARPVYLFVRRWCTPSSAGAIAAAISNTLSIAALCVVLLLAARGDHPLAMENAPAGAVRNVGRFALYSSPFWALGLVAEAIVASSVLAFLARVRPELLP
jgi:cobalt/nickel transport system permease protein